MSEVIISIAQDFSPFPGGRYRADGPFSGEKFRDDILLPALVDAEKNGSRVIVILDGAVGYSSSFLEEVFGGLVRLNCIAPRKIENMLRIVANNLAYKPAQLDAEKYLSDEIYRRS
jgi:hypothetical protein